MLTYHQHEGKPVSSRDGCSAGQVGWRRWHGGPGTAQPNQSLPRLPLAGSDPAGPSAGIAESRAPNGGAERWGCDNGGSSTPLNAISIPRPFSRSLYLSHINSRFPCSGFPHERLLVVL